MTPDAPRILIVEHDDDIRAVVTELLTEEGFDAIGVRSQRDALLAAETRDFSVVVQDFLPGTPSGWEALEEVARAAVPARTGLMTAWRVTDEEVKARNFAFLLRKPFKVEDLLGTIGAQARLGPPDPAQAAVIARYFRALSQSDWPLLGTLVTDGVEYHLPGVNPEFSRTVRGRTSFCDFAQETFASFREARFEVTGLIRLPTAIVGRYHGSWLTPANVRAELPGAVLFHFDGARISKVGVRLDLPALFDKVRTNAH